MKKGIGCLVLIIALVILSIIGKNTSHYGGGGGMITFIIFTLVFIGLKLISSKNTISSDDKSPNISKSQTTNFNSSKDTNVVKKEEKQSSFRQPFINPKKININSPNDKSQSLNYSEMSEIEQIERQYNKGLFSIIEKDELISKIKLKKGNDELKDIMDSLENKLTHEYNNDCEELKDLNNNGLIDKDMLNNKLTVLKTQFEDKMKKVRTKALVEHSKRLHKNKKI